MLYNLKILLYYDVTFGYFTEYRELIKGLLVDSDLLPNDPRMDRITNLWVDLQKDNR